MTTDYQERIGQTRLAHGRSVEQQQVDFWRYVEQPEIGCWEWQRGTRGGYGRVRYRGKQLRTHRLAWYLAVGEIPAGFLVLHTCDNPLCCNPVHLWLGTNRDNLQDAGAKGRLGFGHGSKTHCKYGHEYTEENTYLYKGWRFCRACRRVGGKNIEELEKP